MLLGLMITYCQGIRFGQCVEETLSRQVIATKYAYECGWQWGWELIGSGLLQSRAIGGCQELVA